MKRKPRLLSSTLVPRAAVIAALCLFTAVPAWATADGPEYWMVTGVKSNDVLNIRTGPGAKYQKIGAVPHNGRRLANLGCKGGFKNVVEWEKASPAERRAARYKRWCQIRYRGVTGWVAGWYLREDPQ